MSKETIISKKIYYKILPEDLTCHGFKYQLGLNIDTNEFDDKECQNGIHFSDVNNIPYWLFMYDTPKLKIAKLHIPNGYDVIEFDSKYKSHAIYIEEIRELLNLNTVKWMIDEGIDISVNCDTILRLASIYGHLDIVKYLVEEQGADIHTNNHYTLQLASIYGHLDVVKYLVEQGADIHPNNEHALQLAFIYGNLDIVKYLKSLK